MSTKCTLRHADNFHLYTDCFDTETVYLDFCKPCGCRSEIVIPFEIFKQIGDHELVNKAKENLER